MSNPVAIPHVVLPGAWGEYSPEFRYSIVAQVDEIYFCDGSVAVRDDDDIWTAVALTQLRAGSEADCFVASTRLQDAWLGTASSPPASHDRGEI